MQATLRIPFVLSLVLSTRAFSAAPTVIVEAGEFDRHNSVVTFELPSVVQRFTHVKGPDGKLLPIQNDPPGNATFILPDLAKGKRAAFVLTSSQASSAQVVLAGEKSKLKATVDGRTLLEYQAEPGELPRGDIKQAFV